MIAGAGVHEGKSLYKMNMCIFKPDEPATVCLASAVSPKTEKLQFWHERLYHQNKRRVAEFLQQEGVNLTLNEYFCEACAFGKSHRQPFYSRTCRATKSGEIIHADVCGPMKESPLRGTRYFVSFKDDFSR